MRYAYGHHLFAVFAVGEQQRKSRIRMLLVACAGEPHGVGMVEVVGLLAESPRAACVEQYVENGPVGRRFALHAVIVAVEDAGIPLLHQQDQTVRQWL